MSGFFFAVLPGFRVVGGDCGVLSCRAIMIMRV
jgi:hypothetical protein